MTVEADRQTAALDFRIGERKRSRGGVRKAPTSEPNLLVIEALGILGRRGGGCRVSVNGWALATSKITKLVLSIGTQVIATAFYGVARPEIARLYPARPEAEHCGFILAADLPIGAAGTVELLLTVHTMDGRIGTGPLRIDIPPQQLTPLTVKRKPGII